MSSCIAIGCTNRPRKNIPGITFHRFPKNKELQEAWIVACKRKNWIPSNVSILCSEHFSEDQFDRTSVTTIRLRQDAVPHIFEGLPSNLQEMSNIKKRKAEDDDCDYDPERKIKLEVQDEIEIENSNQTETDYSCYSLLDQERSDNGDISQEIFTSGNKKFEVKKEQIDEKQIINKANKQKAKDDDYDPERKIKREEDNADISQESGSNENTDLELKKEQERKKKIVLAALMVGLMMTF